MTGTKEKEAVAQSEMTELLTLEQLGWSDVLARVMREHQDATPARIASVYSARVEVWTTAGPRLASLRSRALREPPEGGIAVGDWVAVAPTEKSPGSDAKEASGLNASLHEVVVEAILPRRTVFLRQAAGERAEPQAIAANIDRVFIVTAVDTDFNLRRIERYLVAIAAGGAEAQIVLTKSDLVDAETLDALLAEAGALATTFATSAKNGNGTEELLARIPRGTTATLVGSSGVGKSALVNRLLGREAQLEQAVRAYDGRGRHTTTRRELFVLPGNDAGLLIDTPGMRELKPWLPDGAKGVGDAFDDVTTLAEACRYRDCLHTTEPDCAVRLAIESGQLDADRFQAWQKLAVEQSTLAPRQATFAATEAKRHGRSMSLALRKRLREKDR